MDALALSPDSLSLEAQQNLFQKAKINKSEEDIQFYLGSFLVSAPQGGSYQFICKTYSFVELTFISVGVSLSGHKGRLILQAPCLNHDEELIGPFTIPLKKIISNPDQRFFSDSQLNTFIRFYDTAILLMKDWRLITARFFNEEEEDGFLVQWKIDSAHPDRKAFQIKL